MSLKREEARTLTLALPAIGEDAKMQRVLSGSTSASASTQPQLQSPSPRAVLARAPSPSSRSSSVASSNSSLVVTTLVPTTDSNAGSDGSSRKMSFTMSPKAEPVKKASKKKKKHRPPNQKRPKTRGYSPSQWRRRQLPPHQHQDQNEDEDDELVPIRRRFHSSDIVLRSSPAVNVLYPFSSSSSGLHSRLDPSTLALRRWVAARAFDGRRTNTAIVDSRDRSRDPSVSGEEDEDDRYEPEPPLADPTDEEFERLDQRRRTCSENFTKSSRAPAEFFPKRLDCDAVDVESDGYTDEELVVPEEEEHKSEEGELGTCEDDEESVSGLEERQRSAYDGSWASMASSVYQYGVSASAAEYTPESSFTSHISAESDGQNLEKLRNLQKLYQEGFITVTEYKDRRVQLVGELSEADQTIAKTTDLLSHELPIIYREPPDFTLLRERDAIKHVFDSEQRKWTSSRIKVKIDTEPFAKGGLRQVFHLQDLSVPPRTFADSERGSADEEDINESSNSESVMGRCTSYVAKIAIDPNENPDTYFRDVEMQAVAAKYAKLYNSYNPPRRVEFLEAWILQLIPDGDNGDELREENLTLRGTICGVEPFIAGEYHKHNNNYGYVSELERNTPQTFSHFSYEASGQQILVVDIQGVGDHYTDPQIHTRRGKEFGKGNLSVRGFERFLGSHRCNPICRYLKLPLINPKDEEPGPSGAAVDPKGTIPAQTYMSQPRVLVDQVDSVLCHYYGDSKAFKRYNAKKKRQKKKREKEQQRQWQEQQEEDSSSSGGCGSVVGVEHAHAMQEAGSKFAAVLLERQRSCTSFMCGGVPSCSVS